MELWENRIVNGILKSSLARDADEVNRLLALDVEIVADPARAATDLWPCIWATAAALSRQFSGRIVIRSGLGQALPGPATLDPRCDFNSRSADVGLRVGIGVSSTGCPAGIWGDARGASISFRRTLTGVEGAHPVSAFALAGYLSYAALASVVGIPPFREEFTVDELRLPISAAPANLQHGLTFIGLGQLGHAYLSLLYFLAPERPSGILLLDKDVFEEPNRSTQLLLEADVSWIGKRKAEFLEAKFRRLGWGVDGEVDELKWGWKRPSHHPGIAVLGLDDLEVRRMAVGAGYEWIVEGGVGTSFLQPRISWHSLPPDTRLARRLFSTSGANDPHSIVAHESALAQRLKRTPGECGWVTFNNIRASTPAMGLVAAAYAWCAALEVLEGAARPVQGRACLWSPLLPTLRDDPR